MARALEALKESALYIVIIILCIAVIICSAVIVELLQNDVQVGITSLPVIHDKSGAIVFNCNVLADYPDTLSCLVKLPNFEELSKTSL